ncbi:MAG: hypothetical protein LOY04_00125, partial [Rhodococcus ruber]|nr:hypothetical protein [Rhodococcus ruber]
VENHVQATLRKLQLANRAELTRNANEQGLDYRTGRHRSSRIRPLPQSGCGGGVLDRKAERG